MEDSIQPQKSTEISIGSSQIVNSPQNSPSTVAERSPSSPSSINSSPKIPVPLSSSGNDQRETSKKQDYNNDIKDIEGNHVTGVTSNSSGEELEQRNESNIQSSGDDRPSQGIKIKKVLSFKRSNNDIQKEKHNFEQTDINPMGEITLRNKKHMKEDGPNTYEDVPNTYRMSYMMKTKGRLYYKKKGAFSKWKLYYVVLDDSKMQMNFFKSQEDYEKLAGCKMVIDLRFIVEVKPQKPRLLQGNSSFKMLRRAGLSTVKLAAVNEEERAKWLTTIEGIVRKIKVASAFDYEMQEKRFSTLPNTLRSRRTSTDSEATTSASAPEQDDIIRPKKIVSSGFKLDSDQITSIKLKRVSSEKNGDTPSKIEVKDLPKEVVEDEAGELETPKNRFGVKLRRVKTERDPIGNSRERSPEYEELKQKFSSLSLSRINGSPKLPFKENLSKTYKSENINLQDTNSNESISKYKDKKQTNPRRTPSPKIPISKSVEAVIKIKDDEERLPIARDDQILKLNLCHATSAVITYDESSEIVNESNRESVPSKQGSKEVSSVPIEKKITSEQDPNLLKGKPVLNIAVDKKFAAVTQEKMKETESTIPETKSKSELSNINTLQSSNLKENIVAITQDNLKEKDIIVKKDSDVKCVEDIPSEFPRDDLMNLKLDPINNIIKNDKEEQKNVDNNVISKINNEEYEPINELLKNKDSVAIKTTESVESVAKSFDLKIPPDKQFPMIKGIMSQSQIERIILGKNDNITDSMNIQKRHSGVILLDPKLNEDTRISIHSFQSQASTESDEPLPKLNFLGKGDRCSTGSFAIKEFFSSSIKDTKKNKLYSSEEVLLEAKNKPQNTDEMRNVKLELISPDKSLSCDVEVDKFSNEENCRSTLDETKSVEKKKVKDNDAFVKNNSNENSKQNGQIIVEQNKKLECNLPKKNIEPNILVQNKEKYPQNPSKEIDPNDFLTELENTLEDFENELKSSEKSELNISTKEENKETTDLSREMNENCCQINITEENHNLVSDINSTTNDFKLHKELGKPKEDHNINELTVKKTEDVQETDNVTSLEACTRPHSISTEKDFEINGKIEKEDDQHCNKLITMQNTGDDLIKEDIKHTTMQKPIQTINNECQKSGEENLESSELSNLQTNLNNEEQGESSIQSLTCHNIRSVTNCDQINNFESPNSTNINPENCPITNLDKNSDIQYSDIINSDSLNKSIGTLQSNEKSQDMIENQITDLSQKNIQNSFDIQGNSDQFPECDTKTLENETNFAKILDEQGVRTSGIVALKNYLEENKQNDVLDNVAESKVDKL